MASEKSHTPEAQQTLLRVLKILPAQILLHGSALLAVAAIGGADLPGVLGTLAATTGINVLSNMLERVARGEEITDEEIRQTVEAVISSAGIEKLLKGNDFQRGIAHLFRRLDLLKYAVEKGEINITILLSQQFKQYTVMLEELKDDMGYVRAKLDTLATSQQAEEISKGIKQISHQIAQQNLFTQTHFPTELVNQEIENETERLRKSRFFLEFDRERSSIAFAGRLVSGDLSGGNAHLRCRALAWCARVLASSAALEKAEEYLEAAKNLGAIPEVINATAFVASYKGNKNVALSILANLDLPETRSAAFMVIAHHDGPKAALEWLETTRTNMADLDPDGRYYYLMQQLQLAQWDAAKTSSNALKDQDFWETPVLYHIKAITYLVSAVPTEFREIVLNQVPFDAGIFPLASDSDGLQARRTAHQLFTEAVRVAEELNCYHAEKIDEEYLLWLELRDPATTESGRHKLETRLRDPKSGLGLIHFGLQFGVKLDSKNVEQEIERQIAIHGGITRDIAIARYALAFMKGTPEDAANYIAQHQEELIKFFDKKYILLFQIGLFLQAGLLDPAIEHLDALLNEGLSPIEERRIRTRIAEFQGSDRVESRKEQFNRTDSLSDLANLVVELESKRDWEGVCEYGSVLFKRTRSIRDAVLWVNALSQANRNEQIIEFSQNNREFLVQSKILQMIYCWALYYEGELLDARSELGKLNSERHHPNYRALEINLAISLGDWNSLLTILANEYAEQDKRSAQELIAAAQLAVHLNSPHSKALVFEAAAKGADDPNVLATAYFLASSAGWENDPDVSKWLEKAAALSGDDGPIQKMTLQDLFAGKPEWDRRQTEISQLLSTAQIPMFLAAQSLNKSLIYMMLFPALANLSETDPRRRILIPAYSGKRQTTVLDIHGAIGIDATALLTLSLLNLIEMVLDAFEIIYIPHSTLAWLFDEKQRADFHQPSRIADAHQLLYLLAGQFVEKLTPGTVPDSNLSSQIGEELALLIAEVEKVIEDDARQRIVVRSSPVHYLGSLLMEEADLTAHATVLSSCQAVVDKLRKKGVITAEEEKKANAYLQLQEKPWPNQPQISDDAILYLDDVSVTYFLHLGILDRLQSAGFRVIISPRKVSEANELISYEKISSQVNLAIERIRAAINPRIESGKIKVGKRRHSSEKENHSLFQHPSVGIFALAKDCNAIVADDRCLNQHDHIDEGAAQSPIFTTLDILNTIQSIGLITDADRLEYRTQLRRTGYILLPIDRAELLAHLNTSLIKNNRIIETAELKAIRENFLGVRMTTWLQLPAEADWLESSLKAFILALRSLWKPDEDTSIVRVRSEWLLNQVDARGWSHRLRHEDGVNFIKAGRARYILMLIAPLGNVPENIEEDYWTWIEEKILTPIKQQFPFLYALLVDWYKNQIAEMSNMDLNGRKA